MKKLFVIVCLWLTFISGVFPTSTFAQAKEIRDIVTQTIQEFQLDANAISIAYTDLVTGDEFFLNEHVSMHAASTTKVATAALYVDLIENGELDWNSELPYNDAYYEDGAGDITNEPKRDYYPIEELIYQMLYYSDNTAWNMLIQYYYDNFGDFQQGLLDLGHIAPIDDDLWLVNYADAELLNNILLHVASHEKYRPITRIMLEAQEGRLLKSHVKQGMATKYGQYEDIYHDTGIYFNNKNQPQYTIVVMTHDIYLNESGIADDFMGILNARLKEWHDNRTKMMTITSRQ